MPDGAVPPVHAGRQGLHLRCRTIRRAERLGGPAVPLQPFSRAVEAVGQRQSRVCQSGCGGLWKRSSIGGAYSSRVSSLPRAWVRPKWSQLAVQ